MKLTGDERPMGVTEDGDRQNSISVVPALPVSTPPPASLRLLLVEDHEATLQVLTRLLTRANYVVATATSVAQAKEAAAANRSDVVMSDVGLSDGMGIDLMHGLHTTYGLRGIALTGYGMEDDLRRSREAGFVEHLVKPVDFAQLRQAIERMGAVKI